MRKTDEQARLIIERFIDVHHRAQTYRHRQAHVKVTEKGEHVDDRLGLSLVLAKRGRARMTSPLREIVWDGRRKYVVSHETGRAESFALPEGADAAQIGLDSWVKGALQSPVALISHLMFDSNPFGVFSREAAEFTTAGEAVERGVRCDVVEAFTDRWRSGEQESAARLYLDQERGLLMRMDLTSLAKYVEPPNRAIFLRIIEPEVDVSIPEEAFRFVPPAASKPKTSKERADTLGLTPAQEEWIGRSIPDLPLERLGSAAGTLRDLRGRVVVVEFWDAERGDAIEKITVNHTLQGDRSAQGVAVVSVVKLTDTAMIDETNAELKRLGLEGFVCLASAGTYFETFVSEWTPLTMIVDREGVIRALRHRVGPKFGSIFAEELDAVITGKEVPSWGPKAVEIKLPPAEHELKVLWKRRDYLYGPVVVRSPGPPRETLMGLSNGALEILSFEGPVVERIALRSGFGTPFAVDLDGDGVREILMTDSDTGEILAFRRDGTRTWAHATRSSFLSLWCVAAPRLPIVIYGNVHGYEALRSDGFPLWKWSGPSGIQHVSNHCLNDSSGPIAAVTLHEAGLHLMDLDGRILRGLELAGHSPSVVEVVPDRSLMAVSCFNEKCPPHLMGVSPDGAVLWSIDPQPVTRDDQRNLAEADILSSILLKSDRKDVDPNQILSGTGTVHHIELGDVDGDGALEIVYSTSSGVIGVLKSDGRRVALAYSGGGTSISVADFDDDGRAEIFHGPGLWGHQNSGLLKLA